MTLRAQLAGRLAFPLGFNLGRSKLWPDTGAHDGIGLDFARNTFYTKVPGAAAVFQPLTSLFTFTGGNQSMYMGPAGLLVPSVTNTPRIEYGAGGDCFGLLMEATRTNLYLQSQDFATSHSQVGLNAVTTNATTAPDGTLTADLISEDTSGSQHRIRQATDLTIASGSTNTFSVFVKANQKTHVSLRMTESTFASSIECIFNLLAGTAGTPVNVGVASGGVARIQPAGNGWFRCSISGALNGGFLTCRALTELLDPTNTNITYTGGGTAGLFVWGGQFEAGAAFPSSYIPTTTVAVARTADSCMRFLGSEFSGAAGSVVVQGRMGAGREAANQFIYNFDDGGGSANRIGLFRATSSENGTARIFTAAVLQGASGDTVVDLAAFKHATAFNTNDLTTSFNGLAAVQASAVVTLPTVTRLGLGELGVSALQMNGHIRTFDYYPSRLTNAQLKVLTA